MAKWINHPLREPERHTLENHAKASTNPDALRTAKDAIVTELKKGNRDAAHAIFMSLPKISPKAERDWELRMQLSRMIHDAEDGRDPFAKPGKAKKIKEPEEND